MKTPINELPQKWRERADKIESNIDPLRVSGSDLQAEAVYRLNELAAELEAALADQWQPIETAPKNGSRVLLNVRGMVVDAFWGISDSDNHTHYRWVTSFVGAIWPTDATHWMPLPTPPKP